jgi:small-conductance mechanosensitive channel
VHDQHLYRTAFECRERRNLAQTLRDNDDVISTLQTLLGFFMHTIALVLYMGCFDVHIEQLLITFSSLSLAFAFVFGNSLRTVYESVVFLFVIRPYQVGHKIVYKEDTHTVRNFGLLSTQLMRYDGRQIWVRYRTSCPNEICSPV